MALTLEEAGINKIISEIVETFRPSLQKNNDELIVNLSPEVKTSFIAPTRLKQVLLNLLGNAVKFTENGVITLNSALSEREGKPWIIIEIIDTGIGIPEKGIGQLFQPFQQVSANTSAKYGGTGLGLAISRRMCQLMGGDITVKSQEGKGSTFTIWLPISKKNQQATPDSHEANAIHVSPQDSATE